MPAQEASAADAGLKSHFAAARDRVAATSQALPIVPLRTPTGVPNGNGVPLDQFRQIVAALAAPLLEGLQKAELAGLRAYVAASLQALPAPLIVKTAKWGDCVRESSARDIVEGMLRLTGRLSKLDRFRLDLEIFTDPGDATFRILPLGGGIAVDRTTNTVITNFYRGLYTYEISRTGHKPVQGRVNLVDERGNKLTCTLVPEKSGEPAKPCRLKE